MKMEVCYDDRFPETTIFLKDNEIIGAVDGNDGNWRDEYFNPILAEMGIKVERRKQPLTKKHIEALKEQYGVEEYE